MAHDDDFFRMEIPGLRKEDFQVRLPIQHKLRLTSQPGQIMWFLLKSIVKC